MKQGRSTTQAIVAALLLGCQTAPIQSTLVAQEIPEHEATTPVSRTPEKGWLYRHNLANDIAKKGGIDLVFLGDALTDYWEIHAKDIWDEFYGDRKAANFGFGADRTQHVLWRIDNGNFDFSTPPKLIVVQIGTNNTGRHTPQEVADGVLAIVQQLRRKLPETKILLLPIFPRGRGPGSGTRKTAFAANDIMEEVVADDAMIRFLDIGDRFMNEDGSISQEIMEDYLHLTPAAYRIWAESIEDTVAELLGEKAG